MKASESNFISLIRRQKEDGIRYVIDTWGGYLRAIVRQRLSSLPDQVDECMNDIFLGIWRNIDSFDESKGSFKNWAAGVARLEAIDCLRKAAREKRNAIPDGLMPVQEDIEAPICMETELSDEMQELLAILSPKDRELFLRIYGNEEDPASVGHEMGLSRDNLYVRLFRGKKKMRTLATKRKEINL